MTRRSIATIVGSTLAWMPVVVHGVVVEPVFADGLVSLSSADVSDAHDPSISADGRFVVFGGTVDDRRSVFRHDRI